MQLVTYPINTQMHATM